MVLSVSSSNSSPPGDKSRDSSPGSEQQSNRSKAGIRVSLACVPCRSKHIKCDATLPICQRCQSEQKPCHYAKSRRGIRDPKRRSMMAERTAAMEPARTFWPMSQMSTFHVPIRFLNDLPAGWSLSRKPLIDTSPVSATITLLDTYYTNFYDSHPFTLPKHYMIAHISTTPSDVQFLISVFCYIGSLFEVSISSDELRDSAFNQACGPLPPTVFNVQGLMILALAASGEGRKDLFNVWHDRAIQTALDLGMQHRSFADAEPDPVVGESHRRTFWALYLYDTWRAVSRQLPSFRLYNVPVTADIPCEEWEYQSGVIPQPVTLAEYDNRDPVGEPEFSSWAYMIELCKIFGQVYLPLKLSHESPWMEDMNRVEFRIMNWLVRIPKWKCDVVGPNGSADWVLYMALGIAHIVRVRLRQPDERMRMGLKEGFAMGPLDRPEAPTDSKLSWNYCPAEVAAANALCSLVKHHSIALTQWCPVTVIGLERVALALLDACVFLGCDTPATREKLSFIFAVLKRQGQVWPIARNIAASVRDVARTYLPPTPRNASAGPLTDHNNQLWQIMDETNTISIDETFFQQFPPTDMSSLDEWFVGQ